MLSVIILLELVVVRRCVVIILLEPVVVRKNGMQKR